MTDPDNKIDTDRSGQETDWLANSAMGYGYGYTREQALLAHAGHNFIDTDRSEPVEMTLVEHVGDVRAGMGRIEADVFVSEEVVRMPADEYRELQDLAAEATGQVDFALEASDVDDKTDSLRDIESDDS